MSVFRTILNPQRGALSIAHSDRILLLGSCFTEGIGQRLSAFKYKTVLNPFGIVYNPVSMSACLQRLLEGDRPFVATELFQHAGLWRSWEHHSRFALPDRAASLEQINTAYRQAADFLRQSNRLLLTLGTADVFLLAETGQIVANNHKMPASTFDSKRLSVAEVAATLSGVLQQTHARHPQIQVVLTVSPVRHLRVGFVENQRSKATLLLACDAICQKLPFVCYFPAYELLMDDLRDYRFYAADMVHPSDTAVDYIWDFFGQTFFSAATQDLNVQIGKLQAAVNHRPFNPHTPEHRAFAQQRLADIATLQHRHPELDLTAEKAYFQNSSFT